MGGEPPYPPQAAPQLWSASSLSGPTLSFHPLFHTHTEMRKVLDTHEVLVQDVKGPKREETYTMVTGLHRNRGFYLHYPVKREPYTKI